MAKEIGFEPPDPQQATTLDKLFALGAVIIGLIMLVGISWISYLFFFKIEFYLTQPFAVILPRDNIPYAILIFVFGFAASIGAIFTFLKVFTTGKKIE